MSFWFYFFIFILGINLGSFINAFNYRLYVGENILKGRSHCPKCQHILTWRDLIPLFSFLSLKGKCRYCHQSISWHYPAVELSAGLLLLIIWIFSANYVLASFYSLIFLILLTLAAFDLKYYLIPDSLLLGCLAINILFWIWQTYKFSGNWLGVSMKSGVMAGALGFVFLGLIYILTRGRGMGFGDVKMIFVIGLIIGWPNIIPAVFLSFFIGAIIGLALVGIGRKNIKEALPFGPFLFLGGLISALWGAQIINWYLSLFF